MCSFSFYNTCNHLYPVSFHFFFHLIDVIICNQTKISTTSFSMFCRRLKFAYIRMNVNLLIPKVKRMLIVLFPLNFMFHSENVNIKVQTLAQIFFVVITK